MTEKQTNEQRLVHVNNEDIHFIETTGKTNITLNCIDWTVPMKRT